MKYIKRFNEDLDPDKYIRAGNRLRNMPGDSSNLTTAGGKKRSTALIDYGSEKKYGLYKIHWANTTGVLGKDLTFTNLRCESYFGRPDSSKNETFRYSAEDTAERWKGGQSPLCITFNFFLQATEETKDKLKIDELRTNTPIFSFEVWFSEWEEGLDIYNWDYDTGEPMTDDDATDINGLYKWTKTTLMYMKRPEKMYNNNKPYVYFGIFSDRSSALKFKRQLNSLLEPHKEKVMELLSCVNAPVVDIEEYEDRINKISINNLFSIEADRDCQSKWFTYNNL